MLEAQHISCRSICWCLSCRDGVGTMISTDFYEGIRPAQLVDLDAIEGLLRPLAQAGITKARSRESIQQDLHSFTVLERESEVSLEFS